MLARMVRHTNHSRRVRATPRVPLDATRHAERDDTAGAGAAGRP
jgi:hypothetical protein